MGMYQDEVRSSRGMAAHVPARSLECDPRTLTERMSNLAQTAQTALDRLGEVQGRITGIRRDEIKSDLRSTSAPTPMMALPHSLESAEGALSLLHDRLAEIERVL